jgi:paraquat-inducible protein A
MLFSLSVRSDSSRLFIKEMQITHYHACPECDLLLNPTLINVGDKAHCPRCGLLLARPRQQSIERSFALSVAGFILIFPANLLPMVGIKMLGNSSNGTLWSGVMALFNEGMWAVALTVFLVSVFFPLIHITLSLLVSGHLYFNRPHRYLAKWMRWMQHLEEWVMLEVYMLGIIVACVKLMSISELKFGLGLYAFISLLLITVMLASSLDSTLFWQRIEQLREQR